jgi:hypothetical protein
MTKVQASASADNAVRSASSARIAVMQIPEGQAPELTGYLIQIQEAFDDIVRAVQFLSDGIKALSESDLD